MCGVRCAFAGEYGGRPGGIGFRPVTDSDFDFLCVVYASARAAEMALVDWSDEQKARFIASQCALQDRHYRSVYVGADLLLIEKDGEPIGRIYIFRSTREIRLMDIALMPEWRNRGIGSALIRELMAEARERGCTITLHVEPDNPAQKLYQRFGFTLIENRGVYDFLGWKPRIEPS